ncbi:MAG: nucleoside-diphosphate sugar epimerase/dehydratase [Polyangiaceae bacterium]
MRRIALRSTQVLVDFGVLSLALALAFAARFDARLDDEMQKRLVFALPYVVGFQYVVLLGFGVPRFVWSYVSLREIRTIGVALGLAAAALLGARLVAPHFMPFTGRARYAAIPMGVIAIDFTLAFIGISGVRALRRILAERTKARGLRQSQVPRIPTILVGAGQAGSIVAKEILARPELGIAPIGFLDDDAMKHGMAIHGVKVLGSIDSLPRQTALHRPHQVVISMASAPGDAVRRVLALAEEAELPVKIIPGIYEILDGRVNLSRIRKVSIEDLLGREPIQLDHDDIERFIRGKRVLVTGAGGSIGSEICRQIMRFSPESLTLVERSEFLLFEIHSELARDFLPELIRPRICDVCDSKRLENVFESERPEVVFHAAAHKHVPMMEWNPGEAVKNNVFGTRKVADMADKYGAEAFVLISTDKAVNPTSIMGATKRVGEMYVQSLSRRSKTKYVAVRFGNVLGSAGSVIPTFQRQIEAGGPVTVTHPEMLRYFMTIPEACQLVLQAGSLGGGGEIFVLDMGTPVKIADLARDLIRLSGFEPESEIKIEYTGVRPGEKLFEELGFDAEKMNKTRHPKIFVGRLAAYPFEQVERSLSELAEVTSCQSADQVREALRAVVPEMQEAATNPPPAVLASAPGTTPETKSRQPVVAAPRKLSERTV